MCDEMEKFPAAKTVTTVKPLYIPPALLRDAAEGIHPTFSPYFLQRSEARLKAYQEDADAGNALFKREELEKLIVQIGSVATGRDNPPKTNKNKPPLRNIDDDWES